MKSGVKFLFSLTLIFAVSASAFTRAELERLSKETLIEIVLDLQSGGGHSGQCTTFNPLNGETGNLVLAKVHPGYDDNGTIMYPDGKIFVRRHIGYSNDLELLYPDGHVMQIANPGYTNHKTLMWPNSQTLQLKNQGYTNDGTVYRSTGEIWLRRNVGYSNDRERIGLPTERAAFSGFDVTANLTKADSVNLITTLKGEGWKLQITLDGATNNITVTECLR